MIGKTISHYKILEKLGEGGMGVVYKAQDTKLKRTVALKFLPPHISESGEEKERFIHEAQSASALNHPNITTIHEIDEFEGQMFIVMEYCEGKTLKQAIEKETLSVKKVLDIGIQVCEGLTAAHKKEIVHRDIKSDNIMITKDGQVKIMDFGLAKLKGASKLTKTGTTLGTLQYMSPEQAQGIEVDQRSDIFSFGMVLYEMITGQLPFKGEHEAAIIYSIVNETPEPLARYKANVPEGLQRIVDKALKKDRNTRYQGAADLIADLKGLLKEMAKGGMVVSSKKRIRNRKVVFVSIGVFIVIVAYAIFSRFFAPNIEEPGAQRKMLAVLPFENLGPKDQEYFADGMMDELTTQLAKVSGLGVISRTSAIKYKKTEKSIRQIGSELGVDYVLEGSVLWDKRGHTSRVRISSQLIRVKDNTHLWAERYDHDLNDVFAIHSEIAQAIIDKLKLRLLGSEKIALTKRSTENLEAYNLYLKGRSWGPTAREKIHYFEEAVKLDPGFAPAYTGLSNSYMRLIEDRGISRDEGYQKSKAAALKALELDDSLADAHNALGNLKLLYEWDWSGAGGEFKRAVELNPGDAGFHGDYGFYLVATGRFDEALLEMKRAQELDPRSVFTNWGVGLTLAMWRKYDQAIAEWQRLMQMDPSNHYLHAFLGLTYLQKGMFVEAVRECQKTDPQDGLALSLLGYAYAASGNKVQALKILEELKEKLKLKEREVFPSEVALVYAGLGEKDQAFGWLQMAYEERWGGMELVHFLKVAPLFDNLRSDPRYNLLLKKMGLEQ
jgi:TolB-like protein/Flp pilus assembly protein TadD/tRNA A-37 threonylcarbamoyl transferase component Bud32